MSEHGKPGPKHTPRADLMRKYGLSLRQAVWAQQIAPQLLACQCEEARRLILGVSEQWGEDEEKEIA